MSNEVPYAEIKITCELTSATAIKISACVDIARAFTACVEPRIGPMQPVKFLTSEGEVLYSINEPVCVQALLGMLFMLGVLK